MSIGELLAQAGRALARHGLVTAFGHVSVRDGRSFVISPPAPLDTFGPADVCVVPLGVSELPPGTPKEAWIHHEIYAQRPDVGAICRSQPPTATAAASAGVTIRPLHGQGSFIGQQAAVHFDSRLVRDRAAGSALAASLGAGPAIILRGNGAVAVGSDIRSAVALMWVLEASAQMNVLGHSAGTPDPLPEEEQEAWRAAAPELLTRIWLYLTREETCR